MPRKNTVPPEPPDPAEGGEPVTTAPSTSSGGEEKTGGGGFFGWIRGLGLIRQNGWIGGVCGGVAARIGIDPVIVRGIAVVIAVLGGPAFLFYAAAWLLLPDAHDTIHLERLIAGHFDPPVVGIGVLVLLTFLPFAQGVWWSGAQFWGQPYWGQSFGRALWSLIVIGLIVAFLIWVGRRAHPSSRGGGSPQSRQASASAAAPGTSADTTADTATGTATGTDSATDAAASSTVTPPVSAPPTAPTPPTTGASAADFEAWKLSQAAWKEQHAAWSQQQAADQRAIRAQRSAEMRAQARSLAMEATERRRAWRRAHPRTSAAYVFAVIGAALVAGAITAGVAGSSPVGRGYEITAGLAVATLVFGLAIAAAGVLRRRSGFLGCVAVLLVLATLISAAPPRDRTLILSPSYGISNYQSGRYAQPIGQLYIALDKSMGRSTAANPRVIDIWQGVGSVTVNVNAGITARVETTQASRSVQLYTSETDGNLKVTDVSAAGDGDTHTDRTIGPRSQPDVIVRITQQSGGQISIYPPQMSVPTPTRSAPATPAPTNGGNQ